MFASYNDRKYRIIDGWICSLRTILADLNFVDREYNRQRIKQDKILVKPDQDEVEWSTTSSPSRPGTDSSLVAGSIVGGSDKKTRPAPATKARVIWQQQGATLTINLGLPPTGMNKFVVRAVQKSSRLTSPHHVCGGKPGSLALYGSAQRASGSLRVLPVTC